MKKKQPFVLSIDFEDFSYDYARSLGISEKNLRINQLEKSYIFIKNLINKYFENKTLTFFVTGIVVENAKDLVKQIISDGNEISSHYYHHDIIYKQTSNEFEYNLKKAVNIIEKVSGKIPLGFRAPSFSIKPSNKWAYKIIMNNFKYDSSFVTNKSYDTMKIEKKYLFEKNDFREIFIFSRPIIFNKFQIRSGGTSFKLFSNSSTKKTLELTAINGHLPQIYLHPYEFLTHNEFLLSWRDLNGLSLKNKIYNRLRQNQWHTFGNNTVKEKLKNLSQSYTHVGKLENTGDYV